MSESPDSERSSQGEKLQIRLVPYSPPRLSGGSELFNPEPSSSSRPDNVEIHAADESPRTSSPPPSISTVVGPSRSSTGKRRSSSIGASKVLESASSSVETLEPTRSRTRSQSLSQSLRTLTSPPSPEIQAAAPAQRRPKRFIDINLNSDNKTFSLVPLSSRASRTDSFVSTRTDSNPHFSVASSASYRQQSSSIFSEDRPSSPLTTLAEDSTSVTASFTPSIPEEDSDSASPWDYRLVGGLRKVDSQLSHVTDTTPTRLPSFLEEEPDLSSKIAIQEEPITAFTLNTKQSFSSEKTGHTVSDRTNYKTYAQSSSGPDTVRGSMASDFDTSSLFPTGSNYVVYDGASASDDQSRAHSHSDSEQREAPNYIVHGHRRTQSDGTDISHAQSEYSRDSMLVAPLRPMRSGRLYSNSTIVSARSLEHLRTGSLTSMSSARMNQDADPNAPMGMSTQVDLEGRHTRNQSGSGQGIHRRSPSRTQPWGPALSTVLSESERSDPSTRSISRLSGNARSSVFTLNQLRQTGSFSTFGLEEALAMASRSRSGSVDRPQPVHGRETPYSTARLVRDHDEDGDGLADLESNHRLPSRARGLSMVSNHSGDRNLRSSSSSRNNSISYAAIPAWARVYYGSGERRFLAAQPSNESMFSQFTSSLHRDSSHSRSPSYEQHTPEIVNPRRRPHEIYRRASESDSMDIRPVPQPQPYAPVDSGVVKKKTSSVWSPHLQHDRRASRYSIWSPPSLSESADFGLWRRNIQLVLFIIGFICPLTWMLGAVLPIPPKPERAMTERIYITGHLDIRMEARHQRQYIHAERLHERLKWWRRVNRRMSIIGAVILSLCIILIAVGAKQQWH
ncbi:hypothetical protein M419DRAFT_105077 [Trichoderma reesei RUT C-30]|uniref:Serine-rich protein n=1 Tax=Hypocrea jecorina (strain ATCC 56765 / BCRC 32924 / NRRL 11460 / Rut C-30) TaxID=1344414 RepID=A0A024RVW1_HYPJR|nr:hypothetical protein M419DRAFT_105077 [Trichoderma reesei RUT C-30]